MASIAHMECCGVKEIHGLSSIKLTNKAAKEFMLELKEHLTHHDEYWDDDLEDYVSDDEGELQCPAFMIFTQAGNSTNPANYGAYGDYFKNFIENEGLGDVHRTEPSINPNSGNLVTVYTWTVNKEAFIDWPKKVKKAKVA